MISTTVPWIPARAAAGGYLGGFMFLDEMSTLAPMLWTGAGGAGCAAATYRMKPPTNVKRYVGLKATGSASGDATTASATLEVLF